MQLRPIKKKLIISAILFLLLVAGTFIYYQATSEEGDESFFEKVTSIVSNGISKKDIALNTLPIFKQVFKILPIEADTKKELDAIATLTEKVTAHDNQSRTYLVLLQNNMELRPGGGFLGQYAIIKVKNGEVLSSFVEDANLLDQRISASVTPPYPFEKMMEIKNWKFRDSNFSPDFPTNVDKAKYFYRLSGGSDDFDGVIAVDAAVLSHVLKLTGPIKVPGFPGEYTSDNAVLKLEEQVEKGFEEQGINVQDRKLILKKMSSIIIDKLFTIENISKLSQLVLEELRNKDVMLNFRDSELQKIAEDVHWSGTVAQDWPGDFLMIVDSNMGALKSDYYMKRSIDYAVDLTPEKPIATLNYVYTHTATTGDWRTSDYHSYMRAYVPKGSKLLSRKMVSYPNVQDELGKTYFGFIAHTIMNQKTNVVLTYELPESVKKDYQLLIQKQSGVGDIPVSVSIKTSADELTQKSTLKKDLKFEIK